ncbi:lysocardiolipin acyltransferase 1-like [Bombyx mandarina]|uniref:Lysocardiolipin acyltransferase 1-like n=1 Tax=Bombyx mandarina TaxID=7092 RepID=A0A6J2KIF1_BOMMA|nr:lysocardiolipin acyltransferase 1-like [Bombyx mandarina]
MAVESLLCVVWYYTIISGFYILYCPVLYLMFINHRLYRKVVDALFELWELFPVALFQCCYSTKLHHFGDYVNPNEKTIMIMNHRTRVDWNYVWIALYHATQNPNEDCRVCKEQLNGLEEPGSVFDIGGKSKIKIVLKDGIKNIPAIGWIMQLNFFLYVKRNWQEDNNNLNQFVDYYKSLKYDYRLVLFPEGTDLSESNKIRSDSFAVAHNLPKYDFVLHPRLTGWSALCSRLRGTGLASVYDVTLAYDNPAQTELDLAKGNIPKNVYFHFKRYSIDKIPYNEEDLKKWLNDRWGEKEISLRKFHKEGNFIDLETTKPPAYRSPRSMIVAKAGFTFWTIVNLLFTYAIYCSVMFQFWVLYHSVLFVIVTCYLGGFQNIQYRLLKNETP